MKNYFLAIIFSLMAFPAYASMSDIKFGQYQIADSQWNVSACLYTTTCQIYSKNPGTAYKIPWTSGQVQWAAGDYVKLEPSGDSNYPYVAKQYTSSGTLKATLGTGKIVNMGPDYFFFVGNDNNTGQLFSGSTGMSDTSGVSWTGTLNPTIAEADAYAAQNYSTSPLEPGETAAASTPAAAEPIYSSSITQQQASRRATALTGIQGHTVDATITGDSNLVNMEQIGDGHYLMTTITGNSNAVDITQSSTVLGIHHYLETNIMGNTNNVNILQDGDTEKTAFVNVDGSNNTLDVDQIGLGAHYLDLSVTGDNHTATVMQQGSGNHSATLELDGSQPWNFSLDQNSATDQTYSLPHSMTDNSIVSGTCAAIGGCNLTVTQQ